MLTLDRSHVCIQAQQAENDPMSDCSTALLQGVSTFGFLQHVTGVSHLSANTVVQAVQTGNERCEGSAAAAHQPWA